MPGFYRALSHTVVTPTGHPLRLLPCICIFYLLRRVLKIKSWTHSHEHVVASASFWRERRYACHALCALQKLQRSLLDPGFGGHSAKTTEPGYWKRSAYCYLLCCMCFNCYLALLVGIALFAKYLGVHHLLLLLCLGGCMPVFERNLMCFLGAMVRLGRDLLDLSTRE